MTKRYALMWSGGKDSALALDRARRAGLDVARLISFYDPATRRVRFHATRVEMLEAQAAASGVGLHAIPTSWPEMEASLGRELGLLHEEGFVGVIFGDIHLADVRDWYETRVVAAGLEHVEPIWGEPPAALLAEFISSGGRAVLTCVELEKLDESWLGRVTDEQFATDIEKAGVDACGENGEYHSFAFAGPVFTRPVRWVAGERRLDAGFAQLDLVQEGGSAPLG
jgi:uncharacterized protein (TIGR00290 family)